MDSRKIRIMLVDDHKMMRQGLRSLLEKQSGVEVVAEVDDGAMALTEAQKHGRYLDIVIIDVIMPRLNGVEAARQILQQFPNINIIALSMMASEQLVENMFLAGARAYILKNRAFPELLEALEAVMQGRTFLSPQLGGAMLMRAIEKRQEDPSAGFRILSTREREALQHLAEGKTAKEIACAMHLSPKTIEHYRERISEKLNLRSLADLVKYAIREGITPSE